MMYIKGDIKRRNGFITLMSVIVMVAVASALAISVILLGTDSLRMSGVVNDEKEAMAIADACAEEALGQIRAHDLVGTANLSVATGTCTYPITAGAGEARTVEVTAAAAGITRKIRITIDAIDPALHITAWEDVADH